MEYPKVIKNGDKKRMEWRDKRMILGMDRFEHFQIVYIDERRLDAHELMLMLCQQPVYGEAQLWRREGEQ